MGILKEEISHNPRNIPGKANSTQVEAGVFRVMASTWND